MEYHFTPLTLVCQWDFFIFGPVFRHFCTLYINAARAGKKALTIVTISDNFITGEKASTETRQNGFIKGFEQDNLQAKLSLISDIELIANNCLNKGSANVVSTRKTRTKEKQRNRSKGVKND